MHIRKITAIAFFFMAFGSVAPICSADRFALAANPVVSVSTNASGTPGQTGVAIPINVSDATGIAGVDITLTFSSSILTAADVQLSSLTTGFLLVPNLSTPGQVILSMSKATGIPSGSGALVNVFFSVSASATPGTTTPLTFQSVSLFDENALPISHTKQNGLFTVSSPSNNPPNIPTNVSPPDGATGVPFTPTLQASAFSDPDAGDTHASSQWQVDNDLGFGSPEFDSGETATDKTSIIVPAGRLAYSTTYQWRVRYKDNRGTWSNWSSPTSFTTESAPLSRIVSIPLYASGLSGEAGVTVPINVNDATGISGMDVTFTFNSLILTAADVQLTPLTSGFLLAPNLSTPGQVILSMSKATGIPSGSGALLNVIFNVSPSAVLGATSTLTLQNVSLFDENALPISHTKENGLFTVGSAPESFLTVVRHSDNTLWAMTCDGTDDCSQWTPISGRFSVQPTLTWDPSIQKYILMGIGNNQASIWRSTFNADGTWNDDWTMITGASPSPVAVAGGGFYCPATKLITNLTVVRHVDNTLWSMACEGTETCSSWTPISGRFSVQPTLTWDPSIQKYILIGIGNDQASIWRGTFNGDGTWNSDWTKITGASPSPVAVVGGGFYCLATESTTNLTVVRHVDNTLWSMACEGIDTCSSWTQISGRFSVQPTLTWDPSIQKYILIGIGNNLTSIWRSTFNGEGTWNNDWENITGASPSPVAVAGGGF